MVIETELASLKILKTLNSKIKNRKLNTRNVDWWGTKSTILFKKNKPVQKKK